MKRHHKATLTTTLTPQAALTQAYTVTITKQDPGTGEAHRITHKTFRLKDLPGLLQAVARAEEQGAALLS